MTDFKQRANSLRTSTKRFEEDSHIKLQSYVLQTSHELDSETRDFEAGVSHENKVKQSLDIQLKELVKQISSLRSQVAETAARVAYLEDFCGTRTLK
jgi:septal ring factor EnvC (AmiA/AmiB activator)